MAGSTESDGYKAWRTAFEASLGSADENRVMSRHYPGGVSLSALQPRDTREHGLPGSGDFRRGMATDTTGWLVGQTWHVDNCAQRIESLISEQESGTQAWLLHHTAPTDDDIARTLDAIGTGAAIDLCGNTRFAARVFAHTPATCININHDPFAAALTTGDPVDEDAQQPTLAQLVEHTHGNALGHRALACHGARYHASGASEVFELAVMFSTFVGWLRVLESASLSVTDCAKLTVFRPAVGRDLVLNIAKLRALRAGIASICTHCGNVDAAGLIRIHAQPATREMSRTGPWVNTLRTTTATAAAALGGADTVFTATHDGSDTAQARRLARNTQLILREESGLHRVQDPAGGAGQFEAMTDQLLEHAWLAFQSIEKAGGIAAAINSGSVTRSLNEQSHALQSAVRTRRQVLTGINLFPDPLGARGVSVEQPACDNIACTRITLSEPFDSLRSRAGDSPPVILLKALSDTSQAAQRVTFCRNLLAVGGLDSTQDSEAAARVVILCGANDDYGSDTENSLASLLQNGVSRVYLAGTPEDLATPLLDSGAHSVIRAGLDAVAFLEDLHAHLGVS